jgi:pimeloyl-ACP methyl ester carboxylesterase
VGLACAAAAGGKVRALAIIDSLPQTTEDMLSWAQSMKSWRPRRYATLEEACASFRLLPAETSATPAMLRQIAGYCYRQEEDGAWVVRIDPRCRARDGVNVFDYLGAVKCPTLIVKAALSPMITPEVAQRMAAAAPRGSMAEIEDAYHHVMLDNPDGLVRALNTFLAPFE